MLRRLEQPLSVLRGNEHHERSNARERIAVLPLPPPPSLPLPPVVQADEVRARARAHMCNVLFFPCCLSSVRCHQSGREVSTQFKVGDVGVVSCWTALRSLKRCSDGSHSVSISERRRSSLCAWLLAAVARATPLLPGAPRTHLGPPPRLPLPARPAAVPTSQGGMRTLL